MAPLRHLCNVKLSQLQCYIQGVMGLELMHLFSHQDGRGSSFKIGSKSRLSDVCRVGAALT